MTSTSPGDWRSSFGFGPGQQAGSLMVAVPNGQQAVHSVAGAGANTASAFTLPTVSARGVTDAQLTKWKIAFQNLCALQGLGVVVQEGKPPQRDAVKKTWPDLEGPAVEQKFNECLTEYQRENTVLYYYVYSSLNFEGDWEAHDLDHTSRVFVSGDLRDGNGLLKWFLSFHDITTPGKQMGLRLKLSKFKIGLDFSQKQLLKMLLDYLTTWEKLLGNNRNDRILLNDFYVKLLDLWPHEPYDNPIVRTRSVVANMQLSNDAMLADVAATINEWMKAAKSYGVPVGKSYSNSPPGTVLALGDCLTAADNDCKFCDVFGCKAKGELKTCVVYNGAVPVGAGSDFPKDMQVRFVKGARAHLQQNPQLKTMKGVRFTIEKAPDKGKGKGGGGRGGGGRGGSRSATPIISSSVNEVHFFGDEGENAQDFESWVQDMQGEGAESEQLAAPAFANFFGGGSPPDEAELTEAIRDEIARASAVAAEAAVSAATPAPATQPIVLMTPNPALTPVPSQAQGQMTPVVRSSLQALRESRPQSGGGITSATSAVSAAPDAARTDEERSVTERLMQAGAEALKQERLATRSLVQSLSYAAHKFKNEILFAVGRLQRFADDPCDDAYKCALQVLKYCIRDKEFGIAWSRSDDDATLEYSDKGEEPYVSVDSSWQVHDKATRSRSTTGVIFIWKHGPISVRSVGQKFQAITSTDAESHGIASAMYEGIVIRGHLKWSGVGFTKPTRLENDNSGGVLIARDAASMHHSRATAMRAVFCQECVEQGMYDPVHVPAATMTADVLTKWLSINEFAKHRAKLTNRRAQAKAMGIK